MNTYKSRLARTLASLAAEGVVPKASTCLMHISAETRISLTKGKLLSLL